MSQRSMQLSLSGLSMEEKVADVIQKIRKVDPHRALQIKFYASELLTDIRRYDRGEVTTNILFTDDVLSDVPDSLEVTIPRGCVKEQLVNQREPVFPEDKRYTIAKSLWDRMDLDQKTLTVLHESWYRTLLLEGAQDSRVARYLNGLFASNEEFSFGAYIKRLNFAERLGSYPNKYIPYIYSFQSKDMEIKFPTTDSQGNLKFYIASFNRGTFQFKNHKVHQAKFQYVTLSPDRKMVKLEGGSGTFFTIDPTNVTRTDHQENGIGNQKFEVRVGVLDGVIEIGSYRVEMDYRDMLYDRKTNEYSIFDLERDKFDVDADLNVTGLLIRATRVYKNGALIKIPSWGNGIKITKRNYPFWYRTRDSEYCKTKDLCVSYNFTDITE